MKEVSISIFLADWIENEFLSLMLPVCLEHTHRYRMRGGKVPQVPQEQARNKEDTLETG